MCLLDLVEGVNRASLLSLSGFLSPMSPSHFLFRYSRMTRRTEATMGPYLYDVRTGWPGWGKGAVNDRNRYFTEIPKPVSVG